MVRSGFEGTGLLHNLDVRVKIVVTLVFSIFAISENDFPALMALLGFPFLLMIVNRSHPFPILKRVILVNGFILMMWLIIPFSYPGHTLLTLGPLTATADGVRYVALLTLKSNAIVLVSVLLLATSSIMDFAYGLERLGMPNRLVQLLFFSFRYIPIVYDEFRRLHQAMRIRSFQPRTNLHTYRSYGYLVGMLLVRSHERAERVYRAMLMRGFSGRFKPVNRKRLSKRDLALGLLSGVYMVAVGVLL